MLERITNLSAPPVVGKRYLVPTVRHEWCERVADWPVFLPFHSDVRFFPHFTDDHYHIDPRFLGGRDWRWASEWYAPGWGGEDADAFAALQRQPIHKHKYGRWAVEPAKPVWRVRECRRDGAEYQFGDRPQIKAVQAHYAGRQCSRARSGWVCPHQHWPMGSVAPDASGVLTCPLHGLRIDAATGLVLAAETQRDAA